MEIRSASTTRCRCASAITPLRGRRGEESGDLFKSEKRLPSNGFLTKIVRPLRASQFSAFSLSLSVWSCAQSEIIYRVPCSFPRLPRGARGRLLVANAGLHLLTSQRKREEGGQEAIPENSSRPHSSSVPRNISFSCPPRHTDEEGRRRSLKSPTQAHAWQAMRKQKDWKRGPSTQRDSSPCSWLSARLHVFLSPSPIDEEERAASLKTERKGDFREKHQGNIPFSSFAFPPSSVSAFAQKNQEKKA